MTKTAWCDDVGDKGHARQLRSIAEADVSDRPDSTASQVYGLGQLQRAMARVARPGDGLSCDDAACWRLRRGPLVRRWYVDRNRHTSPQDPAGTTIVVSRDGTAPLEAVLDGRRRLPVRSDS